MPNYVSFPGVNQVVAASYSLAHGISPGMATLDMAPQASLIAQGGPLVFSDGQTTLTFPDCKVDQASLERNAGGQVVRLSILDRRWKWRFPTISGHYNLRHPSGDLIDDGTSAPQVIWKTAKTPQQLAALLLDAMGETGYDVSALPNGTFPAVEWEHANAAQELATLAEDLGCRVVLRLDGTVQIWPVGFGAVLPVSDRRIDYGGVIDPPERPDRVSVVTGRLRHQVDLVLEAVGQETDGTVKQIDDLSYKPGADPTLYAAANLPDGWRDVDLHGFLNVFGQKNKELAKESVYKWYRPVVPFTLVTLGEDGQFHRRTITDLAEIELTDTQVDEFLEGGVKKTRRAIVWGVWHDGQMGYENVTSTQQTITDLASDFAKKAVYKRSFAIDRERSLIKFDDQLFQRDTTSHNPAPGTITLRTAVYLRNATTRAWERYVRSRDYGQQFGTKAQVIKRNDLLPYVRTDYNATGSGITGQTSNQAAMNTACDHYLDAAEWQYAVASPEGATYAGLWPIDLDGAIQQVSWHIGQGGLITRASRNNEPARNNISYAARRSIERINHLVRHRTLLDGNWSLLPTGRLR